MKYGVLPLKSNKYRAFTVKYINIGFYCFFLIPSAWNTSFHHKLHLIGLVHRREVTGHYPRIKWGEVNNPLTRVNHQVAFPEFNDYIYIYYIILYIYMILILYDYMWGWVETYCYHIWRNNHPVAYNENIKSWTWTGHWTLSKMVDLPHLLRMVWSWRLLDTLHNTLLSSLRKFVAWSGISPHHLP